MNQRKPLPTVRPKQCLECSACVLVGWKTENKHILEVWGCLNDFPKGRNIIPAQPPPDWCKIPTKPHVSQHEGPQNTRKEYFLVTCHNLNTFTSACECAIKEGGVPVGGVAMALVPPKPGETQDAFKYAQAFIREVPRETEREE